ncbi:hypothetical protein BCT09_18115 [Vibrio splendidus]|nr:hypothetical protein BCU38_22030 [Vibrio splendidus]PMO46971.1 hypothetical protein BCT09_18115 [Vibrio splendidus]
MCLFFSLMDRCNLISSTTENHGRTLYEQQTILGNRDFILPDHGDHHVWVNFWLQNGIQPRMAANLAAKLFDCLAVCHHAQPHRAPFDQKTLGMDLSPENALRTRDHGTMIKG